jgi:hypothetical protein
MKKGGCFNLVISQSQESCSSIEGTSSKKALSSNVFNRHSLHRTKIDPNQIVKTYNYVGVKELKSYY